MNPSVRDLLGLADFRRLWLLGLIQGSVRWLEVLAVGLYTLAETDSPFLVALMLFARTFPSVVFGAVTGALASRFGRRRLLLVGLCILTINALVLTALAMTNVLTLWHVAAGALVSGIVWTLEHPVRRTLLGDVAGINRVQQAISLDTFCSNGTRMFGPVIGGSVYAFLGMTGVFAVSTACVMVATWLAFMTHAPGRPRRTAAEPFLTSLAQGLRYARREPIVRGILMVTILANVFGFSYATMVPVIALKIHGLSSTETGLLQAVEGLGAMIMALTLALASLRFSHVRLFSGAVLTFIAFMLIFALSPWLTASALALFAAGAGIAGFSAMQSTVLLERSDPDQRERVMGLLVVCIGAQPLGVLLLGFLAETFGTVTGLTVMGCTGFILIALVVITQPAMLTRLDRSP